MILAPAYSVVVSLNLRKSYRESLRPFLGQGNKITRHNRVKNLPYFYK
jgi:hypothetical protein